MTARTIPLTSDEVRLLARVAGVEFPDDQLPIVAERLGAMLGQLASAPDEALRDVEPAFVLPMRRGDGA